MKLGLQGRLPSHVRVQPHQYTVAGGCVLCDHLLIVLSTSSGMFDVKLCSTDIRRRRRRRRHQVWYTRFCISWASDRSGMRACMSRPSRRRCQKTSILLVVCQVETWAHGMLSYWLVQIGQDDPT